MRRMAIVLAVICSACTTVQSRARAEIDLTRADGRPEVYKYEALESHPINGTAAVCAFTFFFYGGGCWAMLATPYADQIQTSAQHAKDEIASLGCGEVKSVRVDRASYEQAPRSSRVVDAFGQPISQRELADRCAKKKQTAPAETSSAQ